MRLNRYSQKKCWWYSTAWFCCFLVMQFQVFMVMNAMWFCLHILLVTDHNVLIMALTDFWGFLVEAVSLVLNICFYWDNIMLTLVNARNFRKLTISSLHFPWPACIVILISGSSIIISRINKWSLYPLWATFSALETVPKELMFSNFHIK